MTLSELCLISVWILFFIISIQPSHCHHNSNYSKSESILVVQGKD